MAKQITCECGRVIRGATDDEVIEGARDHMRQDHPAWSTRSRWTTCAVGSKRCET